MEIEKLIENKCKRLSKEIEIGDFELASYVPGKSVTLFYTCDDFWDIPEVMVDKVKAAFKRIFKPEKFEYKEDIEENWMQLTFKVEMGIPDNIKEGIIMNDMSEHVIKSGTVTLKKPLKISWFDEDDGLVKIMVKPGEYDYRVLNIRGWKPRQLKVDGEWRDVMDTCDELEQILSEGRTVTVNKGLFDKTKKFYYDLKKICDDWMIKIEKSKDINDVRAAIKALYKFAGGNVRVDVGSPTYCTHDGAVDKYTIYGSVSLKSYTRTDLMRLVEDLTQAYFTNNGGGGLLNTMDLSSYITTGKPRYVDEIILEDAPANETTTVANIAPTVDYMGHVKPVGYLVGNQTRYETDYDDPDEKNKNKEIDPEDLSWVSPIGRIIAGESVRSVIGRQFGIID